jgi:hypothetical protein
MALGLRLTLNLLSVAFGFAAPPSAGNAWETSGGGSNWQTSGGLDNWETSGA